MNLAFLAYVTDTDETRALYSILLVPIDNLSPLVGADAGAENKLLWKVLQS
jgi:hypothetical protein